MEMLSRKIKPTGDNKSFNGRQKPTKALIINRYLFDNEFEKLSNLSRVNRSWSNLVKSMDLSIINRRSFTSYLGSLKTVKYYREAFDFTGNLRLHFWGANIDFAECSFRYKSRENLGLLSGGTTG